MINLFPEGWTVVGGCKGVIVIALPVSGWIGGDCARDALPTESMIRTAQVMARIVLSTAFSSLENDVTPRFLRGRTWAETLSRNGWILGKASHQDAHVLDNDTVNADILHRPRGRDGIDGVGRDEGAGR